MLDITTIEKPQEQYFIAAVPPVVSSVIERQLVDAGLHVLVYSPSDVYCGNSPLTMEEHDAALPSFERFIPDAGLGAIVSNYDQGQIVNIANALAEDKSFRRIWSQMSGFPADWLDGVPDEVEEMSRLILSDVPGVIHGGDAEETPAQDDSRA
jgi:hypothetical protein